MIRRRLRIKVDRATGHIWAIPVDDKKQAESNKEKQDKRLSYSIRRKINQTNSNKHKNSKPKFSKFEKLNRGNFTFPGKGKQPGNCKRHKFLGLNIDVLKLHTGFITCDKQECPLCFKTWLYRSIYSAAVNIIALLRLNPNLKLYLGCAAFSDDAMSEGITLDDIEKFHKWTNGFIKKHNFPAAFRVDHVFFLENNTKLQIAKWCQEKYNRYITRTKMYRCVTTDTCLKEVFGLEPGKWREVLYFLYHSHLILISESEPDFDRIYAGKYRVNTYCLNENVAEMSQEMMEREIFLRNNKKYSFQTIPDLKNLISHLYYLFDHAATRINTKGRNSSTHAALGNLREVKKFYQETYGEEKYLEIWQSIEQEVFNDMNEMGCFIKKVGDKIFPAKEAPDFDETKPGDYIDPIQIHWEELLYSQYYNKKGELVEGKDAEVKKSFIEKVLKRMDELDRLDPVMGYSRRKFLEFVIDKLNKAEIDRSIPSSLKGLFMDDIPNLMYYIESGLLIDDHGLVMKRDFLGFRKRERRRKKPKTSQPD